MYSSGLFYEPKIPGERLWDTWLYHHNNEFFLYYVTTAPMGGWNGIAMATSHDGIHWRQFGKIIELSDGAISMGAGAVWEAIGTASGEKKFIMNFAEVRPAGSEPKTSIFFAESRDLINWTRLDSKYEFPPDQRWYQPIGRWENIWALPRPGGGLYGWWAATIKEQRSGLGFGESPDGINWNALEPPAILGLTEPPEIRTIIGKLPEIGAIYYRSPEIGAIQDWKGKYYAMLGPQDINRTADPVLDCQFGLTTFVADSPSGPFSPAPKNRRLLVGNASYFCRFLTTPDGILVNHHSWETDARKLWSIDPQKVYMAPLKRADWDDGGTLRLKWWNGYEQAKGEPLRIELEPTEKKAQLLTMLPDTENTLILEGRISFPSSLPDATDFPPVGLYFRAPTVGNPIPILYIQEFAFLVHKNGLVEYGLMVGEGLYFKKEGEVDRDLTLETSVHFRLIKKGRLTEFYLDDFLMHCYCLPEHCFQQVGLLGPATYFDDITAWYV